MSKYVGSISVIDDQGNIAFERELGTDEIIGELIERINFFQKPPEPGEGVVVGPHNISRIVKETKKALETPPKKVRGGGESKKGERKKSACGKCGETGHNAKTCGKEKPAVEPDAPREENGDWKSVRAKELLKEGKSNEEVATEINSSPRVVDFIRKRMINAGELE